MSDAELVTFRGRDGVRLVGTAYGNPAHPPLLFLHGGGQQRSSWSSAARRWGQEGWRAITLDARGHGESDWSPDGGYDLDVFVGDLDEIIQQLGVAPTVVGASLGGLTGLGAEGCRPGSLRGLVMVDVSIVAAPSGAERIRSFMLGNEGGFGSLEEAQAAIAAYAPKRRSPPSIDGLQRSLRKRSDGRWYWHWDPRFLTGSRHFSYSAPALAAAAAAVACRLMLVRGALSDVLSQEGVDALVSAQPGTTVAEVHGMGHMVAGQDNGEFGGALGLFLDSLR